ncbi:MAG TPA: DNA primase [Bryobacteraceae bacterium]|nr:DNA primase [Bryobacteraceae bacterium]
MEFIEQLKSAVDIVQVIGDYVQLRRIGGGARYVGLCPFHSEKTGSFSVHAQHQYYKCFGCDAHGDVLTFVMEIERFTFWEAVKYLAEKHGIPLPKRSEHSDDETRHRAALHEMHDMAAHMFVETLMGPAGADARQYLARRGVSAAVAGTFALGLSDRSGTQLVRAFQRKGFAGDDMEASGLVLKRQDGSGFFDRFRGRLMFPIHAESGQVIAFGGRAMAEGDEPKYLNSSETPIYRKSHVLYNLNRARKAMQQQSFTVLVEGYMDVIGVWAAGVENVVATCGTALTAFQVRAMRRHAQHVVLNFDPDEAGMKASERSSQVLLEEGVRLKVLELTGGLDPDEFIQKEGVEAYRKALDGAPGFFLWLAGRARGRFDLKSPEGRSGAFHFLLPVIHRLPDKVERLAVAEDMAAALNVPKGMVLDEFKRAAAERKTAPPAESAPLPDPSELLLLHCLLSSEEILSEVAPALDPMDLPSMLKTGRIIQTILKMAAEGTPPNYSTVSARLSDPDRKLFSCLLEADEILRGEPSADQAREIVKRLAGAQLQIKREQLKNRIKEAEKAGDMKLALDLMSELRRFEPGH